MFWIWKTVAIRNECKYTDLNGSEKRLSPCTSHERICGNQPDSRGANQID